MHSYLHKPLSLHIIDSFTDLSVEANREVGWQDTSRKKLRHKLQASKCFSSEIKELFSLHSLKQKCGFWGLHFTCQNSAFCNISPDLWF